MSQELHYSPITHAHVQSVMHPTLNAAIEGRSVVRYLRFLRRVRVDRLELPRCVYGRWIPSVPTHAAHVTVSVLDSDCRRWKRIKDVNLDPDPRITGEGLSQNMTTAEMDAHLAKVMGDNDVNVIDMAGCECTLLRVECDREHPVWPSHGECNGSVFQVPFGILNPLRAIGEPIDPAIPAPPYIPMLKQGRIAPAAMSGMRCRQVGESIVYEGRHLQVGFSLRRPMLMHLGWDALGEGAATNRLSTRRPRFGDANRGPSGPLLVTPRATTAQAIGAARLRLSAIGFSIVGFALLRTLRWMRASRSSPNGLFLS